MQQAVQGEDDSGATQTDTLCEENQIEEIEADSEGVEEGGSERTDTKPTTPQNKHHMITRSKSGVLKTRTPFVGLVTSTVKPTIVKEALELE